jgi:hypothetical protein
VGCLNTMLSILLHTAMPVTSVYALYNCVIFLTALEGGGEREPFRIYLFIPLLHILESFSDAVKVGNEAFTLGVLHDSKL